MYTCPFTVGKYNLQNRYKIFGSLTSFVPGKDMIMLDKFNTKQLVVSTIVFWTEKKIKNIQWRLFRPVKHSISDVRVVQKKFQWRPKIPRAHRGAPLSSAQIRRLVETTQLLFVGMVQLNWSPLNSRKASLVSEHLKETVHHF